MTEMDEFIRQASEHIYTDECECLIQLAQFIYINVGNQELCKSAIDWVFTRLGRTITRED
jgi:hypothetical protein